MLLLIDIFGFLVDIFGFFVDIFGFLIDIFGFKKIVKILFYDVTFIFGIYITI